MDKTFAAIEKLKEVELELHRLKNALEMMNRVYDAKKEWVGLTDEETNALIQKWAGELVFEVTQALKEKNL